MAQPEARSAASRTNARAEASGRAVRGLAEQAASAADRDASLQGAHAMLDGMAEMSRLGQESLEGMMTAQQALISAMNETGQRVSSLASETMKESLEHVSALCEMRSASDVVTAQLALWKRSTDRGADECRALGDIALRTAEMTLSAWAAAVDRLTAARH